MVVRGMMDVFHVYCFKSVGIYKHKLSRIEPLVILHWGQNCTRNRIMFVYNVNTCCNWCLERTQIGARTNEIQALPMFVKLYFRTSDIYLLSFVSLDPANEIDGMHDLNRTNIRRVLH